MGQCISMSTSSCEANHITHRGTVKKNTGMLLFNNVAPLKPSVGLGLNAKQPLGPL